MRQISLTILFLTALCLSVLAPAHAQKAELVVQEGHRSEIDSVAWSPNGKTLASASADGTVKLWNKSGLLLRTLAQDETSASSVAWSPDGTRVISSHGESIKIWKADSGELLKTIDGFFSVFALSPDGETIAAASGKDENEDFNTIKIFDVGSGKVQRSLKHEGDVRALAWSRDSKRLISGSNEKSVKIWDMPSGTLFKTLTNEAMSEIECIALSPDGAQLAVATIYETDKFFLWNVQTGQLIRTISTKNEEAERDEEIRVTSLAWNPDGKRLASGHADETVRVWDVNAWNCRVLYPPVKEEVVDEKRQALREEMAQANLFFRDEESTDFCEIYSLAWNPDGKTLAAGGGFEFGGMMNSSLRIWDGATGQLLNASARVKKGYLGYIGIWSPDLKKLAKEADDSKSIEIFDMTSGRLLRTVNCQVGIIRDFVWSPDDETLAVCGSGKNINLFKANSGQLLRTLNGHTAMVHCLAWNPNGTQLASGSRDETLKIWNVKSGAAVRTIVSQDEREDKREGARQAVGVVGLAWNPNGKTIASHHSFADNHVAIWDVMSGALLDYPQFDAMLTTIANISWHPGGEALLIQMTQPNRSGTKSYFDIYDVRTKEKESEQLYEGTVISAAWSPDGKTLAVGGEKQLTTLTFAPNKTVSRRIEFAGYKSEVGIIAWSPDGKTLAASDNSTLKFWDVATRRVKLTIPSFANGDSLAIDPQGRFDGTPSGLEQLHYVVGLEPVALDQLKERYYQPGLWGKVMGTDPDPTLRDVAAFDEVALYPDVEVVAPKPGETKLTVRLTRRSGGYGRVEVKVGDTNLTTDARPRGLDGDAATQTFTVDLAGSNISAGQKVPIEVVAWNRDGDVRSRGIRLESFVMPGEAQQSKPRFFAIVVGTSQFANKSLNLRFAAKDAADFARALDVATPPALFESKRIALLTTDATEPNLQPAKANISAAFAGVARDAREDDVVVLYFSGHGIGLVRDGKNFYCYLTRDALSASETAFKDAAVLNASTVNSADLDEWLTGPNRIKALKRVLILDTCAAGAFAAQQPLAEQKDVSSDIVLALDKLHDNTGYHVLMGCAASASSYEANRYAQGLLTYSLLKYLKFDGRADGRDVDVNRLFRFAEKSASELAKLNHLSQQPRIIAGDNTFPIGLLEDERRKDVPLAGEKPVLLRPAFINPARRFDNLKLSGAVQARLREICATEARGASTPVYVDVDWEEYADGLQPAGSYRVEGDKVIAELVLVRGGQEGQPFTIEGPAAQEKRDELVEAIVGAILKAQGA